MYTCKQYIMGYYIYIGNASNDIIVIKLQDPTL
jgi:hypothetical protein